MKRSHITRFLIGFFILLTFAHAAFADDEWIEVKSDNFFLIGNAKEKEVRNVAVRLEQFSGSSAACSAEIEY